MKTILEVATKKRTLYTMPEEVFYGVKFLLELRVVKSVEKAVKMLPVEMRKTVVLKELPQEEKGIKASHIFVDIK